MRRQCSTILPCLLPRVALTLHCVAQSGTHVGSAISATDEVRLLFSCCVERLPSCTCMPDHSLPPPQDCTGSASHSVPTASCHMLLNLVIAAMPSHGILECRVHRLKLRHQCLIFEAQSSYGIQVTVTDFASTGSLSDTAVATINLIDINEPPVLPATATASVDENSPKIRLLALQ